MSKISNATGVVLNDIADERIRQDAKWGEQNHPDGTGPEIVWALTGPAHKVSIDIQRIVNSNAEDGCSNYLDILLEEVAEAFAEADSAKLRTELVQVAAVAVQWIEAIDRRTPSSSGGGVGTDAMGVTGG